ncbi:MAG TPA: DUF2760 domain-containing protein [Polyangia bacterium]|jgi:hypothetical protein
MWRRIKLAFVAFFRVLLGKPLPEDLVPKLPPPPAPKQIEAPPPAPKPEAGPGALQLLGLLQREGRLVDFLTESIDGYEDAEIGAAVRDIHRGCRKVLDEHFGIEPVMTGAENEAVVIEPGFDPNRVRLTGNLGGQPPFKGTLRHRGWRAKKVKLPKLADGMDATILAPAEVEL